MPKLAANFDPYRAGRRLRLRFADTPRLLEIKFEWRTNVKGAPWIEASGNTGAESPKLDTPLPSALADFFVAFAAWAAGDREVSFSYADQSKAKTIRNARDSTKQYVHKVFVSDNQKSCFNGLFIGSGLARPKKSRTHKHATRQRPRPIVLRPNQTVLPADCLKIIWDKFGQTPLKAAEKLCQLLSALRGDGELTKDVRETCLVDISRIDKYAPAELIGRDDELALLNDAWEKTGSHQPKRPHILTFVALGGEGKTSLVAKWAVNEMLHKGWPGCEAAFAWSFYHQGTGEKRADSSDLFLVAALSFFGDEADKQFAVSAASPFEKGQRLAHIVGQRRSLLILDGLEPLQYAPTSSTPGELKDKGLSALLKGLATINRGLCIVTTRYSIPDLDAFIRHTVREKKLTRLSTEAGVELLQFLGVKGSLRKTIRSSDGRAVWNAFEKLVEDVKGHALSLNLLGSYLSDAHFGDIRKRDLVKLEEADEEQVGHAFRVMDAYVQWFDSGGKTAEDHAKGRRALALLQLLGLFDHPATADCLNALWQGEAIAGLTESLSGISEAQRNRSLKRLEGAKLLTVNWAESSGELIAVDAHPMVREYFARRLSAQQPEAWRAAHRRLYEHLRATTKEGAQPTLEDLQPLYQAVAHGCLAALQEEAWAEVYWRRIMRGIKVYSIHNLGAFSPDLGAMAWFFEILWSRVSPLMSSHSRCQLMLEAGMRLRGLGREALAVEVTQLGLEETVKTENWGGAAQGTANLSELKLTLGAVADAVQQARFSVAYAKRSGVVRLLVISLTLLADALHQAGFRYEAEKHFGTAEALQKKHHLDFPPYTLWRSQYYDLLLAASELRAWRCILQSPLNPNLSTALKSCRTVSKRATQELKQLTKAASVAWRLTVGLKHLTMGNASLYEAILEGGALDPCRLAFQNAVKVLRLAGDSAHLPRGLLARAWLRSLDGHRIGPESAQSDLDEAWEIAECGPMPLFLADIHLYRARLFFREKQYPKEWTSPQADLATAEKLIHNCGYHRRDEELADAKCAILGL